MIIKNNTTSAVKVFNFFLDGSDLEIKASDKTEFEDHLADPSRVNKLIVDFRGKLSIVSTSAGGITEEDVDSKIASLTKSSVGLDQVDNTADLDKPISTTMQSALNQKQDKVNNP